MSSNVIDFRSKLVASATFSGAPETYRRGQPAAQPAPVTDRRRDRRDGWRYAEVRLEFLELLRKVALHATYPCRCPESEPYKNLSRNHMQANVDHARLELLLTPAPTRAALAAKRALFKRYARWADETEQQSIEAAIARDEKWLAVNARPAKRSVS